MRWGRQKKTPETAAQTSSCDTHRKFGWKEPLVHWDHLLAC